MGLRTLNSAPASSSTKSISEPLSRASDISSTTAAAPSHSILRSSASAVSRRNQFQVWTGKTAKFTSVSYPTPNPYYDLASIQVLRNAYELYKRSDLLNDLRSHLKKSLEDASDVDRAYTAAAEQEHVD